MNEVEFSRTVRADAIGRQPRAMTIEAEPAEREALARRFGLVRLDRLAATVELTADGADILVSGRFDAELVQSCVATGADVASAPGDAFSVRFRPPPAGGEEEEIELAEEEMDVMFIDGAMIDVGEAVAQTLALALDPFPRAPGAAAALAEAGVRNEEEAAVERSPFGALAGLKDKLGPG